MEATIDCMEDTWVEAFGCQANGTDFILWTSHSHGNGTTTLGSILEMWADVCVSQCLGMATGVLWGEPEMLAALQCAEEFWAMKDRPVHRTTSKHPTGNAWGEKPDYTTQAWNLTLFYILMQNILWPLLINTKFSATMKTKGKMFSTELCQGCIHF